MLEDRVDPIVVEPSLTGSIDPRGQLQPLRCCGRV